MDAELDELMEDGGSALDGLLDEGVIGLDALQGDLDGDLFDGGGRAQEESDLLERGQIGRGGVGAQGGLDEPAVAAQACAGGAPEGFRVRARRSRIEGALVEPVHGMIIIRIWTPIHVSLR